MFGFLLPRAWVWEGPVPGRGGWRGTGPSVLGGQGEGLPEQSGVHLCVVCTARSYLGAGTLRRLMHFYMYPGRAFLMVGHDRVFV